MGESTGFPFDKTTGVVGGSDVVIPVNLAANVSQLHAWMFGTDGYTPSSTVQNISDEIVWATGVQ